MEYQGLGGCSGKCFVLDQDLYLSVNVCVSKGEVCEKYQENAPEKCQKPTEKREFWRIKKQELSTPWEEVSKCLARL